MHLMPSCSVGIGSGAGNVLRSQVRKRLESFILTATSGATFFVLLPSTLLLQTDTIPDLTTERRSYDNSSYDNNVIGDLIMRWRTETLLKVLCAINPLLLHFWFKLCPLYPREGINARCNKQSLSSLYLCCGLYRSTALFEIKAYPKC